jgi:hypothetical protein
MSNDAFCTVEDCLNVSSVCQTDVLNVLPCKTNLCQTHELTFSQSRCEDNSVLDVNPIDVVPVEVIHPDISRHSWSGEQTSPVTATMTTNLACWQYYLKNDVSKDFILDGVKHGFRLIDEDVTPNHFFTRNYKSATSLSRIGAEKQIITEIQLGRYVVTQ